MGGGCRAVPCHTPIQTHGYKGLWVAAGRKSQADSPRLYYRAGLLRGDQLCATCTFQTVQYPAWAMGGTYIGLKRAEKGINMETSNGNQARIKKGLWGRTPPYF